MANNDYLRWSAKSLKELLNLKLTEQGLFSDQNFEDSNLSVLIDIFAYTYDTLSYYLNVGASEAMFTDAEIYENLNRIVKELRYNPRGFITSTVECTMGVKNNQYLEGQIYTIPRYSTVRTGKSDEQGDAISYTFIQDFTFLSDSPSTIDTDFTPVVYNGEWRLYDETQVATGIPWETFTMDRLNLRDDNPEGRIYLAHPYIHVYVQKASGEFVFYEPTTNLYDLGPCDYKFEVRVNENYEYTLKFGDDINGKRLDEGDVLYIIWLKSNGPSGAVSIGTLTENGTWQVHIQGLSDVFINKNILKIEQSDYVTANELSRIYLVNDRATTKVDDFEDVPEMRENAPNWFRMQGRLITEQDFEQYIKANYTSEVYDVVAHNNWAFMVEFQQWLYQYGLLSADIRNFGYKFADSCDFNNVYLWLKSHNIDRSNVNQTIKGVIERDCNRIKPLTSEVYMADPFMVAFVPYVSHNCNNVSWDTLKVFYDDYKHKILLVRDKNSMVSSERIKQRAMYLIKEFFKLQNNKLGQKVDIGKLYTQLSTIDGVKEVKTKYLEDPTKPGSAKYFDGLSFGLWTPFILRGADFTVINGAYKLKNFQFPYLYDEENLVKRIEIATESYKISEIEY